MSKTPALGRPATIKGRPVTITLDDLSRAIAARLGNGNVSAGIRVSLARSAEQTAIDLDDVSRAVAYVLGNGDVSAGVRAALRTAAEPR